MKKRLKLGWTVWFAGAWFLMATLVMAGSASALLPKDTKEPAPSSFLPDEASIAATEADLQKKLEEAQTLLGAVLRSSSAGRAENAQATAMAERHWMAGNLVRSYEQQLSYLKRLRELRQTVQQLKLEVESWQGFRDLPPYPLSLVDDLRKQARALERQQKVVGEEQALLQGRIEGHRAEMLAAEKALRRIAEQVEGAKDTATALALHEDQTQYQWRLRLRQAWLGGDEILRQVNEEKKALLEQNHAFLIRKLSVASANWQLSEADKNAQVALLSRQRNDLLRDLESATIAEQNISRMLNDSRAELQKTLESAAVTATKDLSTNETASGIAHLQQTVETHRIRQESISVRLELLQWQLAMVDAQQQIWEGRFRQARQTEASQQTRDVMDEMTRQLERGRSWEVNMTNRRNSLQPLLDQQEAMLEAWKPGQGDRQLVQDVLMAYKEQDREFTRMEATLRQTMLLVEWFLEDIQHIQERATWGERLRHVSTALGSGYSAVWDFELTSYSDEIVVEGRTISGKRSITVGKVLRVLITLALGLWISRWVARWISRRLANQLRVDASRTLLVERMVYIFLGSTVVVMALNMTKIPFTAFAFLGGALAIGVGFGAQNLINNFISGIMLLIERKVKLGDTVEVEGERGVVQQVGARSTLIRRADGKELIVPNSQFLEKNVVNWTLSDRQLRLTINVGVAYGAPLRRAAELICQAAEENQLVLKDPKPVVGFEDFGDNALVFSLYVWVSLAWMGMDVRTVTSEIRFRIYELLEKEGIAIAFPQRDVHLDAPKPLQVQLMNPNQDKTNGGKNT